MDTKGCGGSRVRSYTQKFEPIDVPIDTDVWRGAHSGDLSILIDCIKQLQRQILILNDKVEELED